MIDVIGITGWYRYYHARGDSLKTRPARDFFKYAPRHFSRVIHFNGDLNHGN